MPYDGDNDYWYLSIATDPQNIRILNNEISMHMVVIDDRTSNKAIEDLV